MALKSGLGAQVGIGTQVAYPTRVVPTTFVPFENESLALSKEYIRYQGLTANRMFQRQDLHVATTRAAGGSLTIPLSYKDMGKFFNLLHGNTVTPVQQAATTAYLQTHNIGTSPPDGKYATVQVGRPDTGVATRVFDYVGCKATGWTISLDAGGIATYSTELDARDETTSETLAAATYSAGSIPFNFTQGVAKSAGTSIGNVRSVTISGSNGMDTSRYHLGNTGLKDEPIVNAFSECTASCTLEFASLADHARFKDETVAAFALELTGPIIATTYAYWCKITFAASKQTSFGAAVAGPDILTADATFEAIDDGTNPPVVVSYQSTAVSI